MTPGKFTATLKPLQMQAKSAWWLLPLVGLLNRIRRAHPAFQHLDNVTFLETESEYLIAYAKTTDTEVFVVAVNLDPLVPRDGLAILPAELRLPPTFPVRDLLVDVEYLWAPGRNYVRLAPGGAHVMQVLAERLPPVVETAAEEEQP